jgi:hypothetical protein
VPHPAIPRVEAVRVVAEDVVVLKLGDALSAVDEAAVIGGVLVMVVSWSYSPLGSIMSGGLSDEKA